jgi:hypothetical protein
VEFKGNPEEKEKEIIPGNELDIDGDSITIKFTAKNDTEVKVAKKAGKIGNLEVIEEVKTEKEENKEVYKVKGTKTMQFLGLFDFEVETEVKIDVESGTVIEVNEP